MNLGKAVVFGTVPAILAVAAALPLLSGPGAMPATQPKNAVRATQRHNTATPSPADRLAATQRDPTPTTQNDVARGGRPATMPTTRPFEQVPALLAFRTAQQFPESFQLLLTRSLFARDGKAAPPRMAGPGGPSLAGGRPPGPSGGPGDSPEWADPSVALRGVWLVDGFFQAMLEHPASHHTLYVIQGATLAGGRVRRITLGGIEYEIGGSVKQIVIGQNLRGETVVIAPTTAPNTGPGAPKGGPPGMPGAPPGQGPPGGVPPGGPGRPPGKQRGPGGPPSAGPPAK